jgi:hypothetical protein
MADSAIIIPIVSLVSSFLAAVFTAVTADWVTLYSEERRRRMEFEKLISKYRDKLFLAACC